MTATAVNPVTREWMPDVVVVFLQDGVAFYNDTTDDMGRVSIGKAYPSSGVHTFGVRVEDWEGQDLAQQMMAQPVTLSVRASTTKLTLIVTRDASSTSHTISGKLMSGLTGLSGRTVKIDLNQTLAQSCVTKKKPCGQERNSSR